MGETKSTPLSDLVVNTDDLFNALSHAYRRYVLYSLKTSETPMTVADLADEVVRWETSESRPAGKDERETITISLYHRHLPKLADANLISFDSDRNLVDLEEDGVNLPHKVVRPTMGNHQMEQTMSSTKTRTRAADHLVDALDAEEHTKKMFHIREALQLLKIEKQ